MCGGSELVAPVGTSNSARYKSRLNLITMNGCMPNPVNMPLFSVYIYASASVSRGRVKPVSLPAIWKSELFKKRPSHFLRDDGSFVGRNDDE